MIFAAATTQPFVAPPSWWDLNWCWCILSLLFGLLAGYKGIYDRYHDFVAPVVRSPWAITYLVIRGVIPSCVFIAVYVTGYFKAWLPLWAAITGAGVETVLRTGFLWKQKQLTADGSVSTDLLIGPFQILNWFQDRCLENAKEAWQEAANVAADQARTDAETAVAGATFKDLLARVQLHLDAYTPEIMTKLSPQITKLKAEFSAEQTPLAPEMDRRYCLKLAYLLRAAVNRKGMDALLRKS